MIESKGHKITPIDGDLAVSRNAEIGGDADIHGRARVAGSLKVEGFLDAPNIKGVVKGLFATEEELKREYPNPRPGWCAIVLADKGRGFLYLAKNREWEKQSEEAQPFDFIVDSINVFASKGELADETQRAQNAEHLLTQRIVNETVRATEAENEIKKNAVKFNRIGITGYADKLELMAASIDGDEVRYIDIPAATETKAGVVSAEDKKKFVKSITWNNDTNPSNMDDFVVAGVYDIKGIVGNNRGNLPIMNTGENASFAARLVVTVSPEGDTTYRHSIGQTMVVSNSEGKETKVYTRNANVTSYDGGASYVYEWGNWGELQRNVNVDAVTSLDHLVDNGIYSGVLIPTGETFVLVVINNYAFASQHGTQKCISQFKYSVNPFGVVSFGKRVKIGNTNFPAEWDILNKNEIDRMLNNAVEQVIATIVDDAPETFDTLKEIADWIANDETGAVALANATRANAAAITAERTRAIGQEGLLNNAIAEEKSRAEQAEQTLDKKIEEIDSQVNGGETYLVEPEAVKDKCYINKDSKKWFDLSSVTGSWNFATAIYPIDKGEEYNITCGSIRDIGVWFLSTNSPISSSTTAVIADSNIPSDAQLSNYPITASNYPYLAITYYYGYEPKVERVNRDCIVNEISTIKDSIADIASSLSIEEEKEILSYEIKNYGLFVKTIFEDTIITNSGNRELSAGNATTNIIPLDWNYGIMINCAGYCYVAFYDENKSFIERKTSYRNMAEIPVTDFPANAKYVAFSYKISGLGIDNKTPDVFATQAKKYSFGDCGVFSSTIKKKRNTRSRIDIYTTDSEYVILSKLMDAFLTEDCDVYFEFGRYNFGGIYKDMYDVYGLGSSTTSKELPLGGNCRYYLNNSTITGTYPADVTFSNGCKVFGNLNEPCGFELYDGTIIANNCGYCIHSESLGAIGFYKHYIKNVKFVQNGGSRPLGCGAGNSTIVEVDSCIFASDTGLHDIAMHGVTSSSYTLPAHTEVIVKNCIVPNGVRCNTLSANETGVLIYINNKANKSPLLEGGWALETL